MDFLYLMFDNEVDVIMKYLEKGDEIGATIAALHQIKHQTRIQKSHGISNNFRQTGNDFFKKNNLYASLYLYNAAIMNAPTGSLALKFAFANRSAVFFELKKFDACLKDINICERLDYPAKNMAKLRDRKNRCLQMMKQNNQLIDEELHEAAKQYFLQDAASNFREENSFNEVTTDGVIYLESSKCFDVGETVIINEPLVTVSARQSSLVCCHHCQRYSENLIPCPRCCSILFCNYDCLVKSYGEYHQIECAMMHMYAGSHETYWAQIRLAIKLRKSAGSWKNFIENYATKPEKDTKFRLSQLLERTLFFALSVYNVNAKTDYFHDSTFSKQECIRGFVQCMSNICNETIGVKSLMLEKMSPDGQTIGTNTLSLTDLDPKLRHACNANLLPMFVRNKIYFIAKAPIAKGETLTVTYGISYPNSTKERRQAELYHGYNFICECSSCVNNWACPDSEPSHFNEDELISLNNYNTAYESSDPNKKLRLICEGVKAFHTKPCSYWFSMYNQLLYRHVIDYQSVLENHYTSGNKRLYQMIMLKLEYVTF